MVPQSQIMQKLATFGLADFPQGLPVLYPDAVNIMRSPSISFPRRACLYTLKVAEADAPSAQQRGVDDAITPVFERGVPSDGTDIRLTATVLEP